jgi:hypothetical protein
LLCNPSGRPIVALSIAHIQSNFLPPSQRLRLTDFAHSLNTPSRHRPFVINSDAASRRIRRHRTRYVLVLTNASIRLCLVSVTFEGTVSRPREYTNPHQPHTYIKRNF